MAAEDADTCFELHFVGAEGAEQSATVDHPEVVAKAISSLTQARKTVVRAIFNDKLCLSERLSTDTYEPDSSAPAIEDCPRPAQRVGSGKIIWQRTALAHMITQTGHSACHPGASAATG